MNRRLTAHLNRVTPVGVMSADEILAQLDASAQSYTFPMLDNGYIYPADVRLTIYRSTAHWLMIIEHLGVSPRAGGYGSFSNCLHLYGSNLHRLRGTANVDVCAPDNPFKVSAK